MPLFELFRLARGKLDPTQEKLTSSAADSSPLPGNDFAELTLENGQVLLQGQCNYGDKKSPALNTNSFTPCSSKPGGEDNAGAGKMGNLNCGPSVFPCTVPSAEISLNQEDDMVPWLHHPISGSLSSDYSSDFLSELPGVIVNKNSVGNNCGSAAKYGQGTLFRESLFSSLQSVNRLEEGTRARTSNMRMLPSSLPLQSQTPSASSLKLQRADFTPSANTSSVMNSSYISRSTAVLRSHNDCDNKMAGLDLSCKESVWGSDMDAAVDVKNTSNPSPIVLGSALGKGTVLSRQISLPQQRVDLNVPDGKSSEEPVSLQKVEAIHPRDALRGNKQSWRPSRTRRGLADGEKTLEPIGGSSSVCIGNGVERASDDPEKHSFKRKSYETEESDGCSEGVEEELLSAKKQTTGRDSPRRTRAAEVHNLSERRRRDRINEKMRALQELIPQCNKVDKASMLDEAIKYIKTLKLQLQMVTMGVGLCMMPTMLPTGIQHMGHMPHYPNMGIGMIPGMHAMGGSMYGLCGQGFPLPMPHTPLVPFSGRPVTNSATGLNNTGAVPMPVENQGPATVSSGRESARSMDIQSVQNTISGCLTEKRPSSQFAVAPRSGRALDKKGTSEVADCTSPKDPKMACR